MRLPGRADKARSVLRIAAQAVVPVKVTAEPSPIMINAICGNLGILSSHIERELADVIAF